MKICDGNAFDNNTKGESKLGLSRGWMDGWMNGWMVFFNNFFYKTHTSGYFIQKICKKNPKVITINNVRSILKKSVAFLPT
jgi:hypothetical protein